MHIGATLKNTTKTQPGLEPWTAATMGSAVTTVLSLLATRYPFLSTL